MKKITYALTVIVTAFFCACFYSCSKKHMPPSASCVDVTKLEYKWHNAFILEQSYEGNTITAHEYVYPDGIFTLNATGVYNVYSNNVPLDGNWQINEKGCQLVLDDKTPNQRSFNIDLLTADSLTISRKDTLQYMIYSQHYYKIINDRR